jgi:hypothetical protein
MGKTNTSETLSRQERLDILRNAQFVAAQGQYAVARALFSSVGISYCEVSL